jgi:hypothetical protein
MPQFLIRQWVIDHTPFLDLHFDSDLVVYNFVQLKLKRS